MRSVPKSGGCGQVRLEEKKKRQKVTNEIWFLLSLCVNVSLTAEEEQKSRQLSSTKKQLHSQNLVLFN